MKERLAVGVTAVAVVAAVALWGLYPAGPGGQALADRSARHAALLNSGPVGKGWRLIFNPRFPGSALNTSVWATCYPWQDVPTGCTSFGGSKVHQWFLPGQVQVSGGILHLVAQPIPTAGLDATGAPKEYACRSGMVTTYPSFRFKYGYLQVVARMPAGAGLWSALWLAAASRKWPPEIDVAEHWAASRTRVYFHPVGAKTVGSQPDPPRLFVGWHTFSLSWTRSLMVWYIDGRTVLSVDRRVPHQLMYLIADLADSWLPGGCTGQLLIRSVKVWQR